ncbi:PstS family phosphate ABC transporter substrate-binding protein [Cyanobacterium aponinum AL20118]|uniref:Phosphate-binding protein n=2 Tax=Cyanobacterium aponinum TaxID=379064 RepID=K9Z292_CYAAP|nr:PstS family phosphate ABC transporter substrate-binding protein [Cyanobacterium aponinum]AFZ52675.1 phosphate ABC transporter substrate-binding protein, PhoT family [Cyanobacterium aponinum PCC 10605]MTF37331.1 phosphate ABC transporter substrate-binding protein PstS family protein [Cyanobacterium aponinum 0216]
MFNINVLTTVKKIGIPLGIVGLISACGSQSSQENQTILIDGSSTVYPVTEAIASNFNQKENAPVEVKVGLSGSIGGFEKFCQGETDINNASVPIPQRFMEECKKNNIAYIELPIAFDALTVVIHPSNDWANTMTVEELKTLWQPSAENKIENWSQINSQWPDKTVNLFGPGRDSGTFEFFTSAIVGAEDSSRNDYVFSENDEALVQGVIQDPNALGYFGFAYYKQHQDKLKAVAIDNGNGGILPSDETIKNNTYRPLTRPLFIYINAKKAQENPALQKFVKFYLAEAQNVVETVGYLPLPESAYNLALIHFEKNHVGTVFNGKPVLNASIDELLTKTYASEDKEGYVY